MRKRLAVIVPIWLPFAVIGLFSAPAYAAGDTVQLTTPHQQTGSGQFAITTVSARNDLISGDSALLRIGVASVADEQLHLLSFLLQKGCACPLPEGSANRAGGTLVIVGARG